MVRCRLGSRMNGGDISHNLANTEQRIVISLLWDSNDGQVSTVRNDAIMAMEKRVARILLW